jgi:AcrR family transcriptional regulator
VLEHVGYRKLTFELLAEHMGVTVEAIHRHYGSIDDLIIAAVRSTIARIEEIGEHRSSQARSASESLWSFVYSDIELCMNTRHTEVYVLLLELSRKEPQLLEIYEAEEQRSRSAPSSELMRFSTRAADDVLANLHSMLHGTWRLLPRDPGITHSDILKSISEYLTRSVPGFDASVLELSAQWRAESGGPEGQ